MWFLAASVIYTLSYRPVSIRVSDFNQDSKQDIGVTFSRVVGGGVVGIELLYC
ncbi:MAG: hypothetical protein IRD3MM_02415 [Candidatus Midichloria mitochondrii]